MFRLAIEAQLALGEGDHDRAAALLDQVRPLSK